MNRILAVFTIATVMAFATAAGAHNANCLDYLAAEVAFDKEVALHRQAKEAAYHAMRRPERVYQDAKRATEQTFKRAEWIAIRQRNLAQKKATGIVYTKAVSKARDAFDAARRKARGPKGMREAEAVWNRSIKEARDARDKANREALAAYYQAVETAEAARNKAVKDAEAARNRAATPAKRRAHERAAARYRAAREKARVALGDAYIRAYANPYGPRRKVSGYPRKIVLKAAVHERVNHCPKMLKKQPEPR